jgi:lipopolysaccharide/colanic/teichoic acid biosynthesis glycosyltransferase
MRTDDSALAADSKVVDSTYEVLPTPARRGFYFFTKRFFDILLSAVALVVLSPLFLVVAIIIKASSKGPVIFVQERVGKDGALFQMYKFRTMHLNSDHLLTPEQKEEYQKEFKITDDPRLIKGGSVLRKTSLDELPQLLNILKGELSIVGPRPILYEETFNYNDSDRDKFLSVKPGLTGYWQAYARNGCKYEHYKRQKMELYYVDHCGFLLDLKILFATVNAVVKKSGAH